MGMEKYRLKTSPVCNPDSVIQGEKYRITMLTPALVRLEYSEDGVFEDRPTQAVLNRDFPVPDFKLDDLGDEIVIDTPVMEVHYNRKPFAKNGLMIRPHGRVQGEWGFGDYRYGWPLQDNLGGTARTLDNADGEIPVQPGLMSQAGYAVVDDSRSMVLREDGFVGVREHPEIDLYVFIYRFDFLQCLKDFYHLCGKPPLLPRYALGNWWSRYHRYTQREYMALVQRFEAENLPFTVAVMDSDWHIKEDVPEEYGSGYTGYTWNRKLLPDPEGLLSWLHAHNMRVTLNVHPSDGVRAFEEPYERVATAMGVDPATRRTVYFDPADPKFMDVYLNVLCRYFEDQGVDFWWIDWQQGDVCKIEGLDPLWMLNHYHYLDSKRRGRRPITFSRYAGIGSHRYPVGFSGDSCITWNSLDFQPCFTSTASNVGYGWWSHDIGGHLSGYRDNELSTRWVQFGVFSPINRLHSTDNPFNGKEPWNFDAISRGIMNRFLRLRHQMIPYLYTMNRRASRDGIPLILPMYYLDTSLLLDKTKDYVRNQYYFGSELIVAPVTQPVEKGVNMGSVHAWLPDTEWVDFFNGTVYRGNRWMELWRSIETIPVLLKAGGIVPMRDSSVTGNSVENPSHMEVLSFPVAEGSFTLWEDAGDTPEDLDENWAGTTLRITRGDTVAFIIEKAAGNLSVIPARRAWKLVFAGINDTRVTVLAGGKPIEAQANYDEEHTRLTVHIPEISVRQEIRVVFGSPVPTVQNDVAARCFRILFNAGIAYDFKNAAYTAVRRYGSDAASAIIALREKLGEGLVSALMEVLTAR